MKSFFRLGLFLSTGAALVIAEPYEIRIFENAPPNTFFTMSSSLEIRISQLKSCFGHMETNATWFDFNAERWIFFAKQRVSSIHDGPSSGTLYLLCAASKMHVIDFHVHITRKNRYPPKFSQDQYTFYIPLTQKVGSLVGRMETVDLDSITYNSQVNFTFEISSVSC
ncbi:hypothetical protein AB6A40_005995 [Gnathostoma spinigerum]|uniref:Uncharacterized protein n=1 Tax=Gnathostoma spinigerum TaxID=75299 RepID=A0ABD6EPD0_9BILA